MTTTEPYSVTIPVPPGPTWDRLLRRLALGEHVYGDQPEQDRSRVDVPLLRKAVEWVETEATKPEHEREWVQAHWRLPQRERRDYYAMNYGMTDEQLEHCGTAYCVAGYVCALAGEWGHEAGFAGVLANGQFTEERAREHLGLDADDAERLFDGHNDAATVREIAEEIAGEKL